MKAEDLCRNYPVLYHIAWEGSWPNIRDNGLMSTKMLLQLYGKRPPEIALLTRQRRPHWVPIECPGRPRAMLRDQKPMTDEGLKRALGGKADPWQWYELINSIVFFWPTKKRLKTMLLASAYQNLRHDVLVVDTRDLVRLEAPNIRLSRLNSGCTKPFAHERDLGLFKTFSAYPFDCRRRNYGKANAVAEVCVLDEVACISEAVVNVQSGSASEIMASLAAY